MTGSAAGLHGRVAIVTGAASGIGRACAEELGARGSAVVIADIDRDGAEAVATAIREGGGQSAAFCVDLVHEEQVAAMAQFAVDTFGRLDILHNNAALMDPEFLRSDSDVVNLSTEVWERTMAVNLRGVMYGCKFAVPHMIAGGGGSIINTTSGSGMRGDVFRTAYGVSKAGVIALTRYVAAAYGEAGVRCNAISPGWIDKPTRTASVPSDAIALAVDTTALRRAGTVHEMATVVAFLASDDASFISGQVIVADGGQLSTMVTYPATRRMVARKEANS